MPAAINRLHLAGVAGAAILMGCAAVGPDYQRPEFATPAAWQRAGSNTVAASEDLSTWWLRFQDPLLSALVDEALAGSLDLRTAQARVRQARALRGVAGAALFPSVQASGSARRSDKAVTTELWSAGFDASWEPDVFGGARRGIEASQADVEASEANLGKARVTLVAEVALNYIEVRGFQARLAAARANLASQTETFQLTDWRSQAGLVGSLDVERARTNLEQTRAQIPTLETSLAQAEHRLAVLTGRAPGSLHERLTTPAAIPLPPASVAVGIPADTLRQRPDVRAAERTLAAETARIGKAEAARYPGLSLTGSIGTEAISFAALGGAGTAVKTIAAALAATIFDGGKLRAQVEAQNAVAAQALANYEAAILTALEDVENALTGFTNATQRQATLRVAAEAAQNAELLARQRYEGGLTDFLTVLDAQRTLLTTQDNLAAAQADAATAVVQLYKALGGGWPAS